MSAGSAILALVLAAASPATDDPAATWAALDAGAVALANDGDLEGGLAKAREAAALARERFGADDGRTATALTTLGEILLAAETATEAETALRAALAIRERVLAPLDPLLEQSLNLLAKALEQQGRQDDALALVGRSIALAERAAKAGSIGPAAPRWTDLIAALQLASLIERSAGRGDRAGALLQRAAREVEAYRGDDGELALAWLADLYDSAYGQGDEAVAEALARQRVALAVEVAGEDSLAHAEALRLLAASLARRAIGADASATEVPAAEVAMLERRAYAIAEPLLAAGDVRRAEFLRPLAERLGCDDAEGRRYARDAFVLLDTATHADALAFGVAAANHADCLARQRDDAGAVPVRRKAVDAYTAIYGTPSWMVANQQTELAASLQRLGQLEQAAAAWEAAAAAVEPELRLGSGEYFEAQQQRVVIALQRAMFPDAVAPWQAIVALREAAAGADDARVVEGHRELAVLARVAGIELAPAEPLAAPVTGDPHWRIGGGNDPALRQRVAEARTAAADGGAASAAAMALLELGAELLAAEAQLERAAAEYEKLLSRHLTATPRDEPALARTARRLEALYRELGDDAAAAAVRERAARR